MECWKLPPKAKIFEAMSAVADGRVKLTGETSAEVSSSSGDRTYHIEWNEDLTQITSDDNASLWQGYLGYPALAVLMVKGKLPCDATVAAHLAGIPWKRINKQFRNDYEKAVESVLESCAQRGVDVFSVRAEAERIMSILEGIRLERLPRRKGMVPGKA